MIECEGCHAKAPLEFTKARRRTPSVVRYLAADGIAMPVEAARDRDLVCQSLLASLVNDKERKHLSDELARARIKPRIERVHRKFQQVQDAALQDFPRTPR